MKKTTILALLITAALPLAAAADNAAVYKSKCASCHGKEGDGQTPIGKKMNLRDLRSPEVQKQSNAELLKIIADGKGKMPGYKAKLSAEELKGLVEYMRELVPNK